MLEIRNIADEIAERGHRHSARVMTLESSDDPEAIEALGLRTGPVFHSRIVHCEEGEPIQFEDRYVNPALFPAYLEQDFTVETPNHYMVRLAPIQRAEFRIYAQKPDAQVRRHLVMEIGEPCLLLRRRTWVGGQVATSVQLWHPASRFHLAGGCRQGRALRRSLSRRRASGQAAGLPLRKPRAAGAQAACAGRLTGYASAGCSRSVALSSSRR